MKPGEVFNPWRMFAGALIPESILASADLPSAAKTLYGQLKRYSGEDGRCFPSQVRLAADLGVSVRTVQRNLRVLVEAGLIERVRTRPGFPQEYVFLWTTLLESCQKVLGDTTVLSSQTRQKWRVPYRKKRIIEENHGKETVLVGGEEMWKSPPIVADAGQLELDFETGKSAGTSSPTSTASEKSTERGAVRPAGPRTKDSIPPKNDSTEGLESADFAKIVRELAELKRMPAGRAVSDRTSAALARLEHNERKG